MRMTFFATLAAFMILTLTGCGSNNNPPPEFFTTSISSVARVDGDIKQDFAGFTVTQGATPSVLAGLDPFSDAEYRAFLHFSLTSVPVDAIIDSAFLRISIDRVDIQAPADTIPMRVELVSFQPPVLIDSDFDLPSDLGTFPVSFPIFLADSGRSVSIDVTPLMIAAQRSQLADFQIRIMEDFGFVTRGLIEINETTLAPLLTVNYF